MGKQSLRVGVYFRVRKEGPLKTSQQSSTGVYPNSILHTPKSTAGHEVESSIAHRQNAHPTSGARPTGSMLAKIAPDEGLT